MAVRWCGVGLLLWLGGCVSSEVVGGNADDETGGDDTRADESDDDSNGSTDDDDDDDGPTGDDGDDDPTGDDDDDDVPSPCGNGDMDPGEECDDGNDVNGDGCQNDCTTTGGETVWTVEIPEHGLARGATALPGGGFAIVTAGSLQRFDTDGQLVWIETEAFLDRHPNTVTLDVDGNLLVGGGIDIDPKFVINDAFIGAFSVDDGSNVWMQTYGQPRDVVSMAVGSDGTIFMGGYDGGEGGSCVFNGATGSTGDELWIVTHPDTCDESGSVTDILVRPDGNAVYAATLGLLGSLWLETVAPDGTVESTIILEQGDGIPIHWSVDLARDGGLVVTGADSGLDSDVAILRFDDEGNELWRSTLAVEGWDYIYDAQLGPDGTIFYCGGNGADPPTGIYGAFYPDGEHSWSQSFAGDGEGRNEVTSIALLSDGTLLLAGGIGTGSTALWLRKVAP